MSPEASGRPPVSSSVTILGSASGTDHALSNMVARSGQQRLILGRINRRPTAPCNAPRRRSGSNRLAGERRKRFELPDRRHMVAPSALASRSWQASSGCGCHPREVVRAVFDPPTWCPRGPATRVVAFQLSGSPA